MKKRTLLLLLLLGVSLSGLDAQGEKKFKTKPGTMLLGGSISVVYIQALSEYGFGVVDLHMGPLFGQFITKDTMLFTHLDFKFNAAFPDGTWEGGIGFGVQGRYFFSTEEAVNFYLGLDASFGLDLRSNYSNLNEHILTGPVFGLFLPFNEKIGLDIGWSSLFYIPLNNYQPFAMFNNIIVAVISTL